MSKNMKKNFKKKMLGREQCRDFFKNKIWFGIYNDSDVRSIQTRQPLFS